MEKPKAPPSLIIREGSLKVKYIYPDGTIIDPSQKINLLSKFLNHIKKLWQML